jgi:RNA polymerase sigma-70 factor (ECF subfamily)
MPRHRVNEEDFLAVLDSCRGTIFKVCLLYTDRSPEAIEDLFQEIACNLWVGYGKFDHKCSVNTWVYKVATRTALMQKRYALKQPTFVSISNSMYEEIADTGKDERISYLYELLDMLSVEDKALIDMYLEGIPQKEIALQLGLNELAVNKRISRIKEKLKKKNNGE